MADENYHTATTLSANQSHATVWLPTKSIALAARNKAMIGRYGLHLR